MIDSSKKLLQAAAGAAGGGGELETAIEEVFSIYLYAGNDSTQTITNGIDLAGEGGLVWIKGRDIAAENALIDTERGVNKNLLTNQNYSQNTDPSVDSFNSNGFSINSIYSFINDTGFNYASWTFRKAPRFFDVVTYTGDGATSKILNHSLGVNPGFVVVKRTDAADDWAARSNTSFPMLLNTTDAQALSGAPVENGYIGSLTTQASPNTFTVIKGNGNRVNASGGTYVAYLFAHDPLGPSGDGSDGLIACGSYTGNGADDGPTISLGWEPQWLLIKRSAGGTGEWILVDTMRGMTADGNVAFLEPNTSDEEVSNNYVRPTADGFKLTATGSVVNASGSTYIYIAIRRGPMRAPTSGTEVFNAVASYGATGSSVNIGFPYDWCLQKYRDGTDPIYSFTRLTGISTTDTATSQSLFTNSTAAEAVANSSFMRDVGNLGFEVPGAYFGTNTVPWCFRRAPGFFDVVAYSGNSVAGRTVPHNLGVAPEMGIFRVRNSSQYNWNVYLASLGTNNGVTLNSNNASSGGLGGLLFNNTAPTSSEITLGDWAAINAAGNNYIAYLFATLPGVSKVGSYTGNGTSQTIDCGFTSGARFILIKRTDSTGDWYVWDSARGIVAGNDPHLRLNSTAAEVTTDDSIDPDSSGFIVNQVAATNINVSSASYIFLAIA
jgi:hypothetical protein